MQSISCGCFHAVKTPFCAGSSAQPAKKKGPGTKMLDDMRKKGKPVTPKVEEMALWLDSLDTSTLDDGQVSIPYTLSVAEL